MRTSSHKHAVHKLATWNFLIISMGLVKFTCCNVPSNGIRDKPFIKLVQTLMWA